MGWPGSVCYFVVDNFYVDRGLLVDVLPAQAPFGDTRGKPWLFRTTGDDANGFPGFW